jgi:predicted ester cyclase
MAELKHFTDAFWAMFEAGEIDGLAQRIDADCHFKMPGLDLHGRDALLQMLRGYREAFPDLRHAVRAHVEAGDTIALELEVTGTHTGPMQTPQGTVAATGKKITWESCDYLRVKQGRVISWHVYHDPAPFLAALGVVPPR